MQLRKAATATVTALAVAPVCMPFFATSYANPATSTISIPKPATSTAAAITLRRTIFVAPSTALTAELLLHELRHVHQFQENWAFPVSYLWQSLRYGYTRNEYEVDARRYSASRLGAADKEL